MGVKRETSWLLMPLLVMLLSMGVKADPLSDFNGNARDLGEFTGDGKWLVVMLWKSDCRISNAVVHEYVDLHAFQGDAGVRVLGVSLDGAENRANALAFVRRHGIQFSNLIGRYEDMAAMVAYLTGKPWRGTPTFLIYGPDGFLRGSEAGHVPADTVLQFIRASEPAAGSRP